MPGTRGRPSGSSTGQSRRRRGGGDSERAEWALVNPLTLVALVAAVTSQGGAIRFGYSRDGGAYSIGFLGDGEPYTEWIRPAEDIEKVLAEFVRGWTGEVQPPE